MKGNNSIKNPFDAVYHLEIEKVEGEETILKITSDSHYETHGLERWISRTFKDNFPIHEKTDPPKSNPLFVPNKKKTLHVKDVILESLEANTGKIGFDKLLKIINDFYGKDMDVKNVYKALKELEENGLIERVDGKTWQDGIKKSNVDQVSNKTVFPDDVGDYNI